MTDSKTFESDDRKQSKSQRVKTTIEFFREKFADEEETQSVWIDPQGGNAGEEREAKP